MTSIGQTTHIPDTNFEQYLIDTGYDSGPLDGVVLTSNISGITYLNPSNRNISDLTGIEDFTALKYLQCDFNNLTSLNLSYNTALIDLNCASNSLISLDVSNTALIDLFCVNNNLTSLDVSTLTSLKSLSCRNNSLTSLNLNTNLTSLQCESNNLTSLNVSANTNLEGLDCNNNALTILDVSANTELFYLDCSNNNLTNLDLSTNNVIQFLYCFSNNLTSLDVSNIDVLFRLNCSENTLTSLDVSNNSNLRWLYCHSNSLTSLNVKNGYNSYFQYFDARNNIDLNCIQVDNVNYSVNNWPNKDATASYSLDCSNLDITDIERANFRLYPNPTSNVIYIEFKNPSDIKKIIIYNSLGQLIIIEENQTKIDVSKFSKGVYFIEITSSKGKAIKKFIVS